MDIIQIDASNIDREHICCAIGNDKENQRRAHSKKEWMKARFAEGLIFRRFDLRGKVFIEYMPVETVWKPILGRNFFIINCLWVSGQYKGKGYSKQLLEACIADARAQGKDGIAVVTSQKVKPFLTDKKFYLWHGFTVADAVPPYFELLVLKWNTAAENPQFAPHIKTGESAFPPGLTVVYSRQCPFMDDFAHLYVALAHRHGFEAQAIELTNTREAQALGSPFGTFGIWYNGIFQFHELMPESKFEQYLSSLDNGK